MDPSVTLPYFSLGRALIELVVRTSLLFIRGGLCLSCKWVYYAHVVRGGSATRPSRILATNGKPPVVVVIVEMPSRVPSRVSVRTSARALSSTRRPLPGSMRSSARLRAAASCMPWLRSSLPTCRGTVL
eukprot:scaffold40743_cov60-Phaeocystis_antarctica.AAC.2